MEKKLSNALSEQEQRSCLLTFYEFVAKNREFFELGLLVLVAILLFVYTPWICSMSERYVQIGMTALSMVSSVLLFFFVVPCLLFASGCRVSRLKIERAQDVACKRASSDFGDLVLLSLYGCLAISGMMYQIEGYKHELNIYHLGVMVLWFLLCLSGGIRVYKKFEYVPSWGGKDEVGKGKDCCQS